jgi:hypothetical protein
VNLEHRIERQKKLISIFEFDANRRTVAPIPWAEAAKINVHSRTAQNHATSLHRPRSNGSPDRAGMSCIVCCAANEVIPQSTFLKAHF